MNQELALVPVPVLVPQEEELPEIRRRGPRRRRSLKTSTRIRQCSITFNLVQVPGDEVTYVLKIDKVNDVPFVENPLPGIEEEEGNLEQHLPVTELLEHWNLEVRQRNTGRLDKIYFHPRSPKKFRSLTEVSKFIGKNYYGPPQQLQVRPDKKKIPLQIMDVIEADNDGGNIERVLAIMPLNEKAASDDDDDDVTEDTLTDDSGNLVEIPVMYTFESFEEVESELNQRVSSGENSGDKENIPAIPVEEEKEIS